MNTRKTKNLGYLIAIVIALALIAIITFATVHVINLILTIDGRAGTIILTVVMMLAFFGFGWIFGKDPKADEAAAERAERSEK
jgi:small neutral amino acid transporter SnatA (MarC family)